MQSSRYQSHFSRRASPKTVFGLVCAGVTVLSLGTVQASAAEQCQTIKASITKNGYYVHHYRDQAQPSVDLFERYVISSAQCNNGSQAQLTAIASVIDCTASSCVRLYRSNH